MKDSWTWLNTTLIPNVFADRSAGQMTGVRNSTLADTSTAGSGASENGSSQGGGVYIPVNLLSSLTENDYGAENKAAYIWDATRLIGTVRLRQLRVVGDDCSVLTGFDYSKTPGGPIPRCYVPFRSSAEDKAAYGEEAQFKWFSEEETGGVADSWSGASGTSYPGSGYIVDLPLTQVEAQKTIKALMEEKWIDQQTRIVMVDLNLYNVNTNLVSIVRMGLEFDISGKVIPTYSIFVRQPYPYSNPDSRVIFVFEITVFVFFCFHVLTEFVQLIRGGVEYFHSDFWNVLEWIQFIFFIFVIFFHIKGTLVLESLDITSQDTAFVNLAPVTWWFNMESAFMVINCLVTYFKGYKYLELIPAFAKLGSPEYGACMIKLGWIL